uniref:Insulin like 3 n=2 Tax=Canis lupus familiaris TaxID=9615 RepID=A0A8I3PQ36_CANLF
MFHPHPRSSAGAGWMPIRRVPAGAGLLPPWAPARSPGHWCCWARRWRWRWHWALRPLRERGRSCVATTSCGRWCGCAGARAGPPRTGGGWLAATVSCCSGWKDDISMGRCPMGTPCWFSFHRPCPRPLSITTTGEQLPPIPHTTAASAAAHDRTC